MGITYQDFKKKRESGNEAPPSPLGYKTGVTPSDKYLPCVNPHCKSFGHSHPNCRCWGQKEAFFAKGGEARHSCAETREHDKGCEYFAEGGSAGFDPDAFIGSASPAPASAPTGIDAINPPENPALQPPPLESSGFDPDAFLANATQDKYGTAGQQALAGIEGGAQGILGGIAPAIETKILGVPAQDIVGREEANPMTHAGAKIATTVAGVLAGEGIPGAISNLSKIAPVAEEAGLLATAGSKAISGAIQGGLFQTSDEISNALLGKGDPNAPVSSAMANIGLSALLGLGAGGIFGGIGHLAEKEITNFNPVKTLTGIGGAMVSGGIPIPGSAALGGYLAEKFVTPVVEDLIGSSAGKATKSYMTAMMLKMLSSDDIDLAKRGASQVVNYAKYIGRGAAELSKNIDSVFVPAAQQSFDYSMNERERQKVKDALNNGTLQKQIASDTYSEANPMQNAFAKGGSVSPPEEKKENAIAQLWPEQNMLINETKGRVFTHLNNLRPQESNQNLIFDRKIKDPSAEKRFDKAIDLANKPLSVFEHIRNGTLTPEHVQDFTAMYPGLKQHLDKKITERMVAEQMKEKIPDYKRRQSLSLFLGTPLSTELTPASIQAAQSVYIAQPAPMPPQPGAGMKKQKGSAPLSKASKDVWTQDQAAERRQITER